MLNIILYQPEISPNTGNIIRTCFALKAKLHIIKPTSFDIHPKWLKRAAAGKFLTDIEHEIHESYEDFNNKYQNQKIFYVTRYGQKSYDQIAYGQEKGDVFLMFGRESTGIPLEILRKNLPTCIRIPMNSQCRSLNLANCVMLLGYEVARQNKFEGLSKFEVQKGKDWILKGN